MAAEVQEPHFELTVEYGERLVGFSLVKRFANTGNRCEGVLDGRPYLAVHLLVGLSEDVSPLRMTDQHVVGAGVLQHPRADFARIGAHRFPVKVLTGHVDRRADEGLRGRVDGSERGSDRDFDAWVRTKVITKHLDVRDGSDTVLCIFQFAATNGVLIVLRRLFGKSGNTWQRSSRQECK